MSQKTETKKTEEQSDKDWESSFNSTEGQNWLEKMAEKALADFEAGNTEKMPK